MAPVSMGWLQRTAQMRAQYQFPAHGDEDSNPWTSCHNLLSVPRLPRVLDLLDMGFMLARYQQPERTMREISMGMWADISQAVQLKPFSQDVLMTTATTTQYYSYEHDFLLCAKDTLSLFGWPRQYGEGFTEAELRGLVGESVSVPVWTQMCYAFYLNPWAPWWH